MIQDELAVLFGVNQSTVCRYIQLAMPILEEVLPTGKKMTRMIKKAKKKELEQIIHDKTIVVDGTEVPRQRPQDKDARKRTYSGKKKNFNTTITTNKYDLILQVGKTFEGATHDLKMIKEDRINFGKWSKSMHKPDTPAKKRITVLADKGNRVC